MQYRLIFDAAQAGFRYWWFPAVGLGFVIFSYTMAQLKARKAVVPKKPFLRIFPDFAVAFATFWTIIVLFATTSGYLKLRFALATGRYKVVQGRVTKFVPMPYAGHAMESFVVSGRRYEYSDYMVTAGFNNTRSHGGPIKNGIQVRIADVDGVIARLEVAK